eukprot:5614390-Prymnesium_polylepis.1
MEDAPCRPHAVKLECFTKERLEYQRRRTRNEQECEDERHWQRALNPCNYCGTPATRSDQVRIDMPLIVHELVADEQYGGDK